MSIEKDLGRIADAVEKIAVLMANPPQTITSGVSDVPASVPTPPAEVTAPPAQTVTPPPPPPTELPPVTADKPVITAEELNAVAVQVYEKTKNVDPINAVFTKYNATSITTMMPDNFPAAMADLKALLNG